MSSTYTRLKPVSVVITALVAFSLVLGTSSVASAAQVLITMITAGSSPRVIAISPDGTKLYAATTSTKSLMTIDTNTNQVISTYALPNSVSTIVSMAISPDGNTLYISDQHTGTSSLLIVDVRPSTPALISQVAVGRTSNGVAVSPNGSYVYVANSNDNTISVVDTSTNLVSSTIAPVDSATPDPAAGTFMDYPTQIAFAPDGSNFYVTYYKDGSDVTGSGVAGVVKFNTLDNSVALVQTFGTETTNYGHPYGIDVSSDGRTIYYSSFVSSGAYNWIKSEDSNFNSILTIFSASSNFGSLNVQLSADDTLLYVSKLSGGAVNVIKLSNNSLSTVPLTGSPLSDFIAPSPNTASHFAYVGTGGSSVALIGEYLSRQRQTLSGTTGTSLSSNPLTAYGFSGAVTYSISPGLPAGLSFDTATGVISGTPSSAFSAAVFTITATDGTTNALATVTVSVSSSGGGGNSGGSGSTNPVLANTGIHNSQLLGYSGTLAVLLIGVGVFLTRARRKNTK